MRPLLFNIFLAFIWVTLTGEFTRSSLSFGLVVGYLLLFIFRNTLLPQSSYFSKVWQLAYFILYFLWALSIANFRVALEVLTPGNRMRPGIIAIPLDLKSPLQITILANLITLTPGTLSLDICDNQETIYVHSMYVDDPDKFRLSIKNGFEKRVLELFR
jgi:multicomponent Na+:H+ antiporter subunit E